MATKTKNDRTTSVKEWAGSGDEKKLWDMMGLSNNAPATSDETDERTVPDEASAYTPPEDGGEATGFMTTAPIPTDDSEGVAAPDGYGEISGRAIIPIPSDEVAEGCEIAEPKESTEATSHVETNVVGVHTSPTPPRDQIVPSVYTADGGIIAETQPIDSTTDLDPIRRTVKQRKSDLSEYRATFLPILKIIDRKPVFVSRTTRDRLDQIVRLLGERGMSVSGLIENIAMHHLSLHEADIEHWRKM